MPSLAATGPLRLLFSFYKSDRVAAREEQISLDNDGELCTIDMPDIYKIDLSEHDLLRQLIKQHQIPQYLRCLPRAKWALLIS